MDTIYYLCRKRRQSDGETDPPYLIREYLFTDYRLLKIYLDEAFWREGLEISERKIVISGTGRRKKQEFRRVRRRLKVELSLFWKERGEHYCVWEHFSSGRVLPQDVMPLPEFTGYLDPDWVGRVIPRAVHPHFIILDNVPYLPELICTLARRMKSLLWVLPDHYYAEMLEDFAEAFYQEYGLAVDFCFPEADEGYGNMKIGRRGYEGPVTVLDFTERKTIPRIEPAEGSLWIDMAAVEEKERKLLARGYKVTYLSLKKQWAQPQKTPDHIDTASKNRYNTKVNCREKENCLREAD